jgi:nucleotide-binding universal stress UspA family protein
MKEPTGTLATKEGSPSETPGSGDFCFSRIMAPTDFSPNSEKAVDYAIQLARRLGAKLTLLHIVPEPSAVDYSMEGFSIQEIQGWKEEAKKRLADELARAKLQYQDVDAIQGSALHPRDKIVRTAMARHPNSAFVMNRVNA